jgi:hypothetical protein
VQVRARGRGTCTVFREVLVPHLPRPAVRPSRGVAARRRAGRGARLRLVGGVGLVHGLGHAAVT